jgi:hypothetical protein
MRSWTHGTRPGSAALVATICGIGAAVYCLARFPEQFAQLRADPSRTRAAFEEAVRYESPIQTFFRTTTREVEIGDIALGEGEKVPMFLGASNRDPRRWERPDDYDITRVPSGMSASAATSTIASGNCWREWKGNACSRHSPTKLHRSDHWSIPTPLQQHAAWLGEPAGYNYSPPETVRAGPMPSSR